MMIHGGFSWNPKVEEAFAHLDDDAQAENPVQRIPHDPADVGLHFRAKHVELSLVDHVVAVIVVLTKFALMKDT